MDPNTYYVTMTDRQLRELRFQSPEWQHLVALEAMREPWRSRFARRMRQLRLLATEPRPAREQRAGAA
jgi:hypothetical protein